MTRQRDRKSKPIFSIPERNYSPSAFGNLGEGGEECLDFSLVNEASEKTPDKSEGIFSRIIGSLKEKTTEVVDVVTEIQETFEEAQNGVQQQVLDSANALVEKVSKATNEVVDIIGDIAEPIQDGVEEAQDVFNDRVVAPIQDKAEGVVEQIRDFMNGDDSATANAPEAIVAVGESELPQTQKVVAIESGDTLWKIAEEELGDGNRWVEFKEADGSNFTEEEARRLQVGTEVFLPGEEASSKVVDTVTEIQETFEEAQNGIQQQVLYSTDALVEKVTKATTEVVDIIGDVAEPIQDGVKEVQDVFNDRVIAPIQDRAEGVVEQIKDFMNGDDSATADVPEATVTAGESELPQTQKSVTIESGDTLWKIAEEELGDGNRWVELREADGSNFTEEEARRLQVGTEVYLSGEEANGPIEESTSPEPVSNGPQSLPPISSGSNFYRDTNVNPFAANFQGQCTWFTYGRMLETGLMPDGVREAGAFLGNAGTWEQDAQRLGLNIVNKPEDSKSYLMVFPPNVRDAGGVGHVAFLEDVLSNGDIRISESNWAGQEIAGRTIPADQISGIKFVELS